MTDWEFSWDVRGTAQREARLVKAARIRPRRVRRPAERPGPRRVLGAEEVIERFLDSKTDGIVQWARRHAARRRQAGRR